MNASEAGTEDRVGREQKCALGKSEKGKSWGGIEGGPAAWLRINREWKNTLTLRVKSGNEKDEGRRSRRIDS